MQVVWHTPDIDQTLAKIARVSNPQNQDNPNIEGLLKYMLNHGHVSPFEMASVCVELETTRDISRQILRHRSFCFQEFSQRYQSIEALPELDLRECRLQDSKNRQSSLTTKDPKLVADWQTYQETVYDTAQHFYQKALEAGIAKEQARVLLPEGLTTTRLYMSGTIRSWIFYFKQRLDASTQKEHRILAKEIYDLLEPLAPVTFKASDVSSLIQS